MEHMTSFCKQQLRSTSFLEIDFPRFFDPFLFLFATYCMDPTGRRP
ncbi:unnamed protein product [Musa textilis]